ncbi:MAG TPA: ArsR family transcriptional regulator [Euryarchaeota archaeon]|nr:ArsR family transcriptional regulator [Euryarchaeota archaeon]
MDPIEACRLIMDTYAAKILVACARKPKHALELSKRLDIPIAACYRRIHVLEKAGLLKAVDRALTQQGKRIMLYQSMLKNAYIFFEGGKLRVRFQMISGQIEDFGGEWKEIKLLPEAEEEGVGGLVRPLERDENEYEGTDESEVEE